MCTSKPSICKLYAVRFSPEKTKHVYGHLKAARRTYTFEAFMLAWFDFWPDHSTFHCISLHAQILTKNFASVMHSPALTWKISAWG